MCHDMMRAIFVREKGVEHSKKRKNFEVLYLKVFLALWFVFKGQITLQIVSQIKEKFMNVPPLWCLILRGRTLFKLRWNLKLIFY